LQRHRKIEDEILHFVQDDSLRMSFRAYKAKNLDRITLLPRRIHLSDNQAIE